MTEIQHLGAKIEPEKFTFERSQPPHYSFMPHLKKPRAPAHEKKKKYFTVQWQCLMTFD
jgi:hypothetical protein